MTERTASEIRLPRTVKGKRSQFYDDPSVDQMMTFLLELMAEVASLQERADTVERLLEEKGVVTRSDIEAYQPSAAVEAERTAWTSRFIERVMRQHG